MDRKVKVDGANLEHMKVMPVDLVQRMMFMECANKHETKAKGRLLQVASSDRLRTAQQEYCIWKGRSADQIMRLVRHNATRAEILDAPKEPGVSDEQVAWVAKTEAAARAWRLSWREFVDCVYAACMQTTEGEKCASIVP